MAVRQCAIKGCENRGTPGIDVNFYEFPKNKAQAALWLSNCKDGTVVTQDRVCSDHFSKDDFKSRDRERVSDIDTRQYLKDDAVPSIGVKSQRVTQIISSTENKKDLNKRSGKAAETIIEKITKQKLEHLLYHTKFCSVCLENGDILYDFETKVDIIHMHQDIGGTLHDIALKVFGEMIYRSLPSSYLCDNCTETVIDNYIFIQKAKHTAETLGSYVDELLSEVDDTSHKLKEHGQKMDHVILTLSDKYDNQATQDCFEDTQDIDDDLLDENFVSVQLDYLSSESETTHTVSRVPEKNVPEKYLEWFDSQKLAGNKEFKCLDCDNTFKRKFTYIEHINYSHLKVPKLTCDQCYQIFSSRVYFKRHLLKFHTKLFECKHCDKKFKDETTCNDHMSTCLFIKEPLSIKGPAISEARKRVDAFKKKHNQTYSCPMCLFKTKSITGYKNHKSRTHGEVKQVNATHTDCTICHEEFERRRDLTLHLKSHPADSIHSCKFCDKEFKTEQRCRLHIRNIHVINTVGGNSVHTGNMKYRDRSFENDPNFKTDLKQQKKRKYCCDQCNYLTSSANHFEAHVNRFHLKIRPFICETCKKSFSGKHLLRIHKQVHDTKRSIFPCTMCKKVFRQLLGLEMHTRSAHTGEKPYCCDVCGESFVSTTLLCRHKRKKHEEKRDQRMNCPLCDISLCNVAEVRKHIKRIHWKGEGKFNIADVPLLTKEDRDRLEDRRRAFHEVSGSDI